MADHHPCAVEEIGITEEDRRKAREYFKDVEGIIKGKSWEDIKKVIRGGRSAIRSSA